MNTVDARGRSCPEPVILTKAALSEGNAPLQVLVDNQVAVDNITRFARNKGLAVSVSQQGDEYTLTIAAEN